MMDNKKHPASFRDPAGFVFESDKKIYRQVNSVYADNYTWLVDSGLYDLLVREQSLIPHVEVEKNFTGDINWYKTLLPQQLEFISYPYEWSFSMLKDAALLTIEIQRKAILHGMILKDATPFNIQFINSRPVLIDSLSFEKYDVSRPWVAYRQFIQCFIAPLLMARYRGLEMLKLLQLFPDGFPMEMVGKSLPFKSWFNWNVLLHFHLPASIRQQKKEKQSSDVLFTKEKMNNLVSHLLYFVKSFSLPHSAVQWSNYYDKTILSADYASQKSQLVNSWLKSIPSQTVIDLGANTGLFSMAAAEAGKTTVAIDTDVVCIENLYQNCKQKQIQNLVCVCADLTNPTPSIGWNNEERASLISRLRGDVTLALALIHHLAIGKNISFEQIAALLSRLSVWLVIEFVPAEDQKACLMLKGRENIFPWYQETSFLQAFTSFYDIIEETMIPGTLRKIFLMKKK